MSLLAGDVFESGQWLQEFVHAVHLGVRSEVLGRILEGLLVDFVELAAVVNLVLEGVVPVREDLGLLAEVIHEEKLYLARRAKLGGDARGGGRSCPYCVEVAHLGLSLLRDFLSDRRDNTLGRPGGRLGVCLTSFVERDIVAFGRRVWWRVHNLNLALFRRGNTARTPGSRLK